MSSFLKLFLLFFIYSVLGWIFEVLYIFITKGQLSNRGFLIGPYCPIYGFGSIIGILYISQYRDNIFTVFILGIMISCILEYITSYLMEKVFNARWWDYSKKKFNVNGRICLNNAIAFAFLAIILVYIINPFISYIIGLIPSKLALVLSFVFLLIFIADSIVSFKITKRLKDTFKSLESTRDNTKEIKEKVFKILKENNNLFQKRILNSFPNFNILPFRIKNFKKKGNRK